MIGKVSCLILLGVVSIAGTTHAAVTVSISPGYTQLVAPNTLQFTAQVSGNGNTDVIWEVDNAIGGNSAYGTITASGLYTPPAKLPSPALVTVTAVAKADPAASATAAVTLLPQAPAGSTYYVAPDGDDHASGSIDAPWATIQHAADTASAGDTVLVRQGAYNEHVQLHRSGNAAQGFITFQNYPGETAVLDGTGLDIPGGQWGLFTFDNVSNLIVSGFELRNYQTNSRNKVPIGVYVFGAGKELQIVNNRIHDIATTAKTNPNQCGSNAFGLTVYGSRAPAAIEEIAIAGNELSDLHTGCSETLSLNGNVKNFAVLNNLVHDDDNIGIGAIGFEKVSPDPTYDQARDGVIRGNIVYNITSYGNPDYGKQYAADGIYIDGGTNIIVEQNLIHHVDLGIELASEHQGRTSSFVTARNNIVYEGNSAGISIGGYAAKRGGTDHCVIVNNTLYANDTKKTGSGEFQIQFNATNNVFENNILYAGPQNLFVNDFTDSSPDPAALDYNLYFSPDGADKGEWTWQKKTYRGFDIYRDATGLDSHGLFADPEFVSLGEPPDLDIGASSPARNAGAVLGAGITGKYDFAGYRRVSRGKINIGAYQH
ncbi:MAG: right-handed parallel beta-helix repeat-containing protein [Alphaproteobacteria bacterium]|nr:right-handed parallel beta-helix repeat-containing protein [Alphaproteobacteria bacterium]